MTKLNDLKVSELRTLARDRIRGKDCNVQGQHTIITGVWINSASKIDLILALNQFNIFGLEKETLKPEEYIFTHNGLVPFTKSNIEHTKEFDERSKKTLQVTCYQQLKLSPTLIDNMTLTELANSCRVWANCPWMNAELFEKDSERFFDGLSIENIDSMKATVYHKTNGWSANVVDKMGLRELKDRLIGWSKENQPKPLTETSTKLPWENTQTQTKPKTQNNGDKNMDKNELAVKLAEMLTDNSGPSLSEEDLKKKIDEILTEKADTIFKTATDLMKGCTVKTVNLVRDTKTVKVEGQHKNFHLIASVVSQRIPVFLSGPAGSGKTTGAHEIAKALELNFYPVSVGAQTTKTDLMGYQDANGNYVESPVYKAYKNGGVLLLDEIDAGNANTLTMLNAILANGICTFPIGQISKHEDFICIVAGNTWGYGASREYVGRNQLDAAFLDRFAMIPWDYDSDLEKAIAQNDSWVKNIQNIRQTVFNLKIKIVVSPRASIFGATLIKSGMKKSQVEDLLIWNSAGKEIKKKVRGAMKTNKERSMEEIEEEIIQTKEQWDPQPVS